MRRSRFSEQQIVATWKEAEAGVDVAGLLRKHGISRTTFYQWRSSYAGTSASELKRMKELESENTKLKRMIPNGESLVYVRDQLEHASIQTTVDTYGHLIPVSNRSAVDRLDDASSGSNLVAALGGAEPPVTVDVDEIADVTEGWNGGPCRDRTYDPLIKSLTIVKICRYSSFRAVTHSALLSA